MKQFRNVMVVAGMIVLLPFVYVSYKIADLISTEPPPEPPLKHTKKKTVYPDDMPKNFNDWSEYIHRQLN